MKPIVSCYRILAILMFTFLVICFTPQSGQSALLTLSDAELYGHFAITYSEGGATSLSKTDVAGPGVQFTVSPFTKVLIGDNYPVSSEAGGTGSHNADFRAYTSYAMNFQNIGSHSVEVSLFMNTGFTGTSGHPKADTFWGGSWITIGAGKSAIAFLDFSSAETYNAWDDPVEAYKYTNGTWNPIFRLDEVTNIGFQILPQSGTNSADLIVSAVPIPGAALLLASGLLGLFGWNRLRRSKC